MEKIKNNYLYNGLGFPIIIEKAVFKKVDNRWLLKLDVKKLAEIAFRVLPEKTSGLTGAEIRFLRTHLDLSKRRFADCLNVSHTAVNKWEQCQDKRAHMDLLTEVALRAFIKLQFCSEKRFISFYRSIMSEVKNFSKESAPLKIAI